MFSSKSIKLTGGMIALFFVLGLFSCSKKSGDTPESNNTKGDAEMVTVSDNDFAESNEDLLTVDYKEFYDQLAPHGEWIEVTDKDIGMDMKGTASGESPVKMHKSISFSDLFGVKEANADDASFGSFFVWKPAPNLAIGLTAGETSTQTAVPVYEPYTNGQWLHTDAGWYFQAATPVEEVTHHYGRWVNSPQAGWVWVPGRVWAPAWVDWREEENYVAWQPVPPSVYIVNNTVVVPPPVIVEERYVVVEKRYFVEPAIYKYKFKGHHGRIKEWRRLDGVMVVNNVVIDRGPDVNIIQTMIGRPVNTVTINRVNSINEVRYVDNSIYTYAPGFKKIKEKGNRKNAFNKPEKFNNFGNVTKETGRQNDNRNESSGINDKKLSNDNDMKNGKNNQNSNSDNRGNDKGKNKGNDNKGNDNKGNNKGNNDNGKKKGNDDNGHKNKGNDNGKKNDDGNRNKGNDDKGKNKGNDNKGNDNKGGKDNGNKKGRK